MLNIATFWPLTSTAIAAPGAMSAFAATRTMSPIDVLLSSELFQSDAVLFSNPIHHTSDDSVASDSEKLECSRGFFTRGGVEFALDQHARPMEPCLHILFANL